MVSNKVELRDGYNLWVEATQSSQSVSGNSSNVKIVGKIVKSSGYSGRFSEYDISYSASVSGLGTVASGTRPDYDFRNYSTLTLINTTVTVPHNSDGKKTITVTVNFSDGAGTNFGDKSVAVTLVLSTIPRASVPTVSGTATVSLSGGSMTISTNRASSSFTHTLTYSFEGASGTIATGVGTSHEWAVPASLLNRIPDATSGTGTITCKTYSGSTLVGTKTVTFKISVASTVKPTVSTLTLTEAVSAVSSAVGAFVLGQSKIAFAASGASGAGGSTITAYKVTLAGQTFTSASGTSAVLAQSGSLSAVVTVTDSRGRTGTKTTTFTVLAWAVPKITSLKVQRSNSSGTVQDNGTYLKFTVATSVSSLVVSSTQKNTLQYRVGVKARDSSSYSYSSWTTASGTSFSASFVTTSGSYVDTQSYDARLEVRDVFKTVASNTVVAIGKVLVQILKDAISIGKRWERGALDVGGAIYATGAIGPGTSSTGSRPSASSVEAGAMVFDTTLKKPIWSDGSAWRDAAGTAV